MALGTSNKASSFIVGSYAHIYQGKRGKDEQVKKNVIKACGDGRASSQ